MDQPTNQCDIAQEGRTKTPTASSPQDQLNRAYRPRYTRKKVVSVTHHLDTTLPPGPYLLPTWQWIDASLNQLFNTAWDWWGYRIGINVYSKKDPEPLLSSYQSCINAASLPNKSNHSLTIQCVEWASDNP